MFNLPLTTHSYLLNDLINYDHIKKLIIRRFIKFGKIIEESHDPHIQCLHICQSTDWRSVYGRNVMKTCREGNVASLREVDITNIHVNPVPPGAEWRIGLLSNLLQERENPQHLNSEQVIEMMALVCSS